MTCSAVLVMPEEVGVGGVMREMLAEASVMSSSMMARLVGVRQPGTEERCEQRQLGSRRRESSFARLGYGSC
jgi:hypothetical protein